MARCQPRERTSRCVAPPPGMMPIFGSGLPSLMPRAARMMSAAQRQLQPAAKRMAVQRHHQRLREIEEDRPDFANLVADDIFRRARREHPDVRARGEDFSGPGDDDDTAVAVVRRGAECRDQRRAQIEAQRIPGRRIVEDQPPHMRRRPVLPGA